MASVPRRPSSDSISRISIHSEISKLLLPVMASRPACFWKLDFTGRFSLPNDPSSALVTHGGLPITSSGSGRPVSIAAQSVAKKSAWTSRTLRPSARPANRCCTLAKWAGLTSRPTAVASVSNFSRADSSKLPCPHVGSTTETGFVPRRRSKPQTASASGWGVWKSPNSVRCFGLATRRPLVSVSLCLHTFGVRRLVVALAERQQRSGTMGDEKAEPCQSAEGCLVPKTATRRRTPNATVSPHPVHPFDCRTLREAAFRRGAASGTVSSGAANAPARWLWNACLTDLVINRVSWGLSNTAPPQLRP